jgi:hypothetical protein
MRQVKEDLICFLKHGKLENISFDMTREDLIKLLGEPDYCGIPDGSTLSALLQYADYEFYFEIERANAKVVQFQVNHPIAYPKSCPLIFNGYDWTIKTMNITKAADFLNAHRISYRGNPRTAWI